MSRASNPVRVAAIRAAMDAIAAEGPGAGQLTATALVAGGSGLVGSALLPRLVGRATWSRVVAVGRRPLPTAISGVDELQLDFERLVETYSGDRRPTAEEIAGLGLPLAVDDVFCALGTTLAVAGSREAFRRVDHDYPLALARWARDAGARQVLVLSSMGADAASRVFYSRVKGEVEASLAELDLPALQIIRPSFLVGGRREFRLGERLTIAALGLLRPFLPRRLRPIRASRVAAALVAIAAATPPGNNLFESDQLNEIATRARRGNGTPMRPPSHHIAPEG